MTEKIIQGLIENQAWAFREVKKICLPKIRTQLKVNNIDFLKEKEERLFDKTLDWCVDQLRENKFTEKLEDFLINEVFKRLQDRPSKDEEQRQATLVRGELDEFKNIYVTCYYPIQSMILKMGGTKDNAQDIFQEALIVLLLKLRNSTFILTSSICTYLYSVARNLWLKKIGKLPASTSLDDYLLELPQEESLSERELLRKDKNQEILMRYVNELEKPKRTLIEWRYFEKLPYKEICDKLGPPRPNEATIRIMVMRIRLQLRDLLNKDPEFLN